MLKILFSPLYREKLVPVVHGKEIMPGMIAVKDSEGVARPSDGKSNSGIFTGYQSAPRTVQNPNPRGPASSFPGMVPVTASKGIMETSVFDKSATYKKGDLLYANENGIITSTLPFEGAEPIGEVGEEIHGSFIGDEFLPFEYYGAKS